MAPFLRSVVPLDLGTRPHFAVKMTLGKGMRRQQVRVHQTFVEIPKVLEMRCALPPRERVLPECLLQPAVSKERLQHKVAALMQITEEETNTIAAVFPKDGGKTNPREQGPKWKWETAFGQADAARWPHNSLRR